MTIIFLVTLLFLASSNNNFFIFYTSSSFFFHLVIPILCIISFVFYEKTECINQKVTFAVLIPIIIYSVYYSCIALSHVKNGMVSIKYDWYGFLKGGVLNAIVVIPTIYTFTYIIGYIN